MLHRPLCLTNDLRQGVIVTYIDHKITQYTYSIVSVTVITNYLLTSLICHNNTKCFSVNKRKQLISDCVASI